MTPAELVDRAERVRRFSRFCTRHVGVLQQRLPDSPFSLTEARLLHELAHRPTATGTELSRELGLDAGYVSRVVSRFERAGLLQRSRSATDGRVAQLTLTRAGHGAYTRLEKALRDDVVKSLSRLSDAQQRSLLRAMARIETLLGEPAA